MRNKDEDIQIYIIDKTKLDECTDYFDTEFGKVKITAAKISDKREKRKYEKFMYKYLRKQLFGNLKYISAKDKKDLSENYKELHAKQAKQPIQPIEQKQTNEQEIKEKPEQLPSQAVAGLIEE